MKIVTQNKKARHDYFIEDTFEAGIKLVGSEIKSIRLGKVNLNDSHVIFKNNEAYIINMHIAKYDYSSIFNHEEVRTRKLLLHKHQINKLYAKIKEDGYTIIPLKLYFINGLAKVEIALVKGKKNYDKRITLKEKDQEMRLKKLSKVR